jgi:hypothetical protein
MGQEYGVTQLDTSVRASEAALHLPSFIQRTGSSCQRHYDGIEDSLLESPNWTIASELKMSKKVRVPASHDYASPGLEVIRRDHLFYFRLGP